MNDVELVEFAKSTHARQSKLNNGIDVWDLSLASYVGIRFFPIVCRTKGFTDANDVETDVTIMNNDGTEGPTVKLRRTDSWVWPFEPSTVFAPSGSNELGVAWVSEKFFRVMKVDFKRVSGDDPKFPAGLGGAGKRTSKAFRLAFLRLSELLLGPQQTTLLEARLRLGDPATAKGESNTKRTDRAKAATKRKVK